MKRSVSLLWDGETIAALLELSGTHAALESAGRRFEATVRREGSWIEIEDPEGRVARCAVTTGHRDIWVAHEGRTYVLARPHRERSSQAASAAADEIRAPMTGRVVLVEARPGAHASEGDLLLTIEAMKMEFRLTAPEAGVVADVLCLAGDRVELGQLLVRLTLPGGEDARGDDRGSAA